MIRRHPRDTSNETLLPSTTRCRSDEFYNALARADLCVSIGTSGAVYPAAGFVREARAGGARTLELNLEPSEGGYWFDEARHGPATALVPQWVDRMLGV